MLKESKLPLDFCGQFYKIYDVVFTPSCRSKEVSVEGIHRNLLSSVRWRKYGVVNFIIQATGISFDLKIGLNQLCIVDFKLL